ncbi:MAG: DUF4157 domain-containing protein [Pyrinomonadaceae bacterium]
MSKRFGRYAIEKLTATAIAASFVLFAPASFGVAQQGAAGAAAVNPKAAAIAATTGEVLRETSDLRKLSILRDVQSGIKTRDEIERMILHNFDEQSKPDELRAAELTLKKFGLVPKDFQYRPFLVKLLGEQVAGFYEPKSQTFYLVDWIANDLEGFKPVMAHELTHALQDQHFNLRRFEKWTKGDADAELAPHALIEGDATLAMSFYAARNPFRLLALLKALKSAGASSNEQIDKAPRALRETLLFPYQQGLTWTQQIYKRGGWDAVSKAYTELPQSSEQILHAEKYFAHEAPVKVEQPNIASLLGKDWRLLQKDVNGEWNYYLTLDEFLKQEDESKQAAAGWGGDQFTLYENKQTNATLLAQTTVWDTVQDAREFFNAYVRRTARRYKLAEEVMANDDSIATMRREWKTAEGDVVIERRDARVIILEGLPEKAKTAKLLQSLFITKS